MNWQQILHAKDLKATTARVFVLRCLFDERKALSQPEISRKLEENGLPCDKTTVYRTLEALVAAGLVHKVPSADRAWLFSLSEIEQSRHDGESHLHFHCDTCEQTYCLDAEKVDIHVSLPQPTAEAFTITHKELLLHGYCSHCKHS